MNQSHLDPSSPLIADDLWTGIHIATMSPFVGGAYGAIEFGAVAVKDGRICWVGPEATLPDDLQVERRHSGGDCWMTPGLVDCHTHLVYSGNRAREFELRLEGASYETIARAGGGIVSTVKATREADESTLLAASRGRLGALASEGVTTVEIKSGYGLDVVTELRQLSVARSLGDELPVRVVTSFLGAHALPPEYAGRTDAYVDMVCEEALPAVAESGLADAVDAFCETIAFDRAQTERVFVRATELGFPVKLHADQLSDLGGAELAAQFNALSADHLEYTSESGVRAMAEAGTVAVLLPGAFYCLRETKLPPLAQFQTHGVPIAIATDCNPGSAPIHSPLLTMNLACTLFRMTPAQALAGMTREGARALGLADELGTIEVGKHADFVLWAVESPAELIYRIGYSPCVKVIKSGRIIADH